MLLQWVAGEPRCHRVTEMILIYSTATLLQVNKEGFRDMCEPSVPQYTSSIPLSPATEKWLIHTVSQFFVDQVRVSAG